jgi:hypothetical protein
MWRFARCPTAAERHPVAQGLIAFTSQLMSLAMVSDTATAELRNDTLAADAQVPGVSDWLANELPQLDTSYRRHRRATP